MPHPAASFLFMDESGIIHSDLDQPYFGVGSLRLSRPESLHQVLTAVKQAAISDLRIHPRLFEFKFNRVTKRTFPYYRDALQAIVRADSLSVAVIVVDNEEVVWSSGGSAPVPWDVYRRCLNQAVVAQLVDRSGVIVLCDYMNHPRHTRSLEDELRSVPGVFNALLLESDASLLIQAVDLLVGSVLYDFRCRVSGARVDPIKRELVRSLLSDLGIGEFALGLKLEGSRRFEIQAMVPQ